MSTVVSNPRPEASSKIAASPKNATKQSPSWLGGFQDLSREHGFEPLAIEGEVPRDLCGTLYRNGPGRFGVAGERYRHWFDGDGAVSAVRLENGRALGAARVTRTKGFLREEAANARLFGSYDTPFKRPLRELLLGDGKNPANTAIAIWQKRVFATCEAGLPFEIGVDDLASLGETTLDAIAGAFSAHAHYVPSRRCTYNFGLTPGRNTRVDVYALPDRGSPSKMARFAIDGARMCHDFVVTEKHLVFVFAPIYLSLLKMIRGDAPMSSSAWKKERGTEIVVVPIDSPTDITRFHVDAFLLEHLVNAFDDGDDVVFDYTHYDTLDALERFVRGLVRGDVDGDLGATIKRGRVSVATRKFSRETILARAVELPRVAPRVEASRHRFAYYVGGKGGGSLCDAPFESILKQDTESGRVDVYAPGADQFPGEGVFVPKDGGTAEDDGWLLTMVYDARENASRLDVLDTRAISDGPVARCKFDHAIPFGFHGAFTKK